MKINPHLSLKSLAPILAMSVLAFQGARSQVIYSDDLLANGTSRVAGTTLLDNNPVQHVASGYTGGSTNWYGFAPTYGWGAITFENNGVQQLAQVPFGSNDIGQAELLVPTNAQTSILSLQISSLVVDAQTSVYFGDAQGNRPAGTLIYGYLNPDGSYGLVHGQYSYTGQFSQGTLSDFDSDAFHTLNLLINPTNYQVDFLIDGADLTGWVSSQITGTPSVAAAGFIINKVGASDDIVRDYSLAVPEPSVTSAFLVGLGLLGVVGFSRRIKRLS